MNLKKYRSIGAVLFVALIVIFQLVGCDPSSDDIGQHSPQIDSMSHIYTDEVLRHESKILGWAVEYNVDADILATLIQVSSCGNQNLFLGSGLPGTVNDGTHGLFQLSSDHFVSDDMTETGRVLSSAGVYYFDEDPLDPNINTRAAMRMFKNIVEDSDIDSVEKLFEAYHHESTPRWKGYDGIDAYTDFALSIYRDAKSGADESVAIESWLREVDGTRLCAMYGNRG